MKQRRKDESGFALLLIFAIAASVGLMLFMEMPRVAFEAQRQREELLIERGEQYALGIKRYVQKMKKYPQTMDELEKSAEIRFLRHRYKDPMTGEDEWRAIHIDATGRLTDSLVQKQEEKKNQNTFISEFTTMAGTGGNTGQQNATLATRVRESDRSNLPQFPGSGGSGPAQPADPNQPPPPPQQLIQPGAFDPGSNPQMQPGQPGMPVYTGQPLGGDPSQPGYPGQQQGNPQQPFNPNQPQANPWQPQVNVQQPGAIPQPGVPGQPSGMMPFRPGMPNQPGFSPPGFPNAPAANSQLGGQVPQPSGIGYQPQPQQQPGAGYAGGAYNQPANFGSQGFGSGNRMGGIGSGQPGTGTDVGKMIQNMLTSPRQGGPPGYPQQQQPGFNSPSNFGSPAFGQGNPGPGMSKPGMPGGGMPTAGGIPGGIAGFASKLEADSIKVRDERTKYNEWEFIYDFAKEQKKAMSAAMGGQQGPQSNLPNAPPGFGSGNPGFGSGNPGFGSGNPGFGSGSPGFGSGGSGFGGGMGQPNPNYNNPEASPSFRMQPPGGNRQR